MPILVGRQTNRIIPQFHISLLSAAVTPSSSPSPSPDNGSSAQVGRCFFVIIDLKTVHWYKYICCGSVSTEVLWVIRGACVFSDATA